MYNNMIRCKLSLGGGVAKVPGEAWGRVESDALGVVGSSDGSGIDAFGLWWNDVILWLNRSVVVTSLPVSTISDPQVKLFGLYLKGQ